MNAQTKIERPILAALYDEFPRECIHWRAQSITTKDGKSKALALAYIDARDVMDRLDLIVGPGNWQDTYEETAQGRVLCTLSIRVNGEWIAKSDGAGKTDVEGDKGALSDALKRAAVKWGIGRYLYSLPAPWVPCDTYEKGGKHHWKKWTDDPWKYVRNAPIPLQIAGDAPDDEPEGLDLSREPEARTKLDGPHTSKTALRKAVIDVITKVREAESNEAISALLKAERETLKQAERDWPALIHGDPNIEEDGGLKGAVEAQRAAVDPENMVTRMIADMKEQQTKLAYSRWLGAHSEVIEALDGADSRRFQLACDLHESALGAEATVTAG